MELNPSECQVMQVTGSKKPIQFNYTPRSCSRDSHLCQILVCVCVGGGGGGGRGG